MKHFVVRGTYFLQYEDTILQHVFPSPNPINSLRQASQHRVRRLEPRNPLALSTCLLNFSVAYSAWTGNVPSSRVAPAVSG